jgi:hypothetical protein
MNSLKTLKKGTGRADTPKGDVVVGPKRALRGHNDERCFDEIRVGFAEGRIYSTVGYADAALA